MRRDPGAGWRQSRDLLAAAALALLGLPLIGEGKEPPLSWQRIQEPVVAGTIDGVAPLHLRSGRLAGESSTALIVTSRNIFVEGQARPSGCGLRAVGGFANLVRGYRNELLIVGRHPGDARALRIRRELIASGVRAARIRMCWGSWQVRSMYVVVSVRLVPWADLRKK